ncbi:MAG TPA: HTTM domain-containing protein [Castellaniella sp.]|nr:HTTM domain-containing protein [Castellaniella sp.]
MTTLAARFDAFWYAPAPAERLALLRILVGGFALGYLLVRFSHLAAYGSFDDRQFEPVGPVAALSSPLPGAAVELLLVAAVLSGVAFVLGWRFAITGPLFALLLLWVLSYRNSFGQIFHTENLLVLHVLVLGIASSADAFSLDASRRPAEVRAPDGRYGWPIRLICLLTVLTYVIAGSTKLQNAGLAWVTEDVLRNYIAYDNLRKAELGDSYSWLGARLVAEGWLFKPLALLTLAVELGAPLALFSRVSARLWVAAAWSFHAGILLLMAIVFPYPLLGVAFVSFFQVEEAWEAVRRRLARLPRGIRGGIPVGLEK